MRNEAISSRLIVEILTEILCFKEIYFTLLNYDTVLHVTKYIFLKSRTYIATFVETKLALYFGICPRPV